MAAISNYTNNTLIDQQFFTTLVNAINDNADKITRSTSGIWDTSTSTIQTSYVGAFAICTVQKTVTDHAITKSAISNSSRQSVGFGGINFVTPPLVFATIQSLTDSGANSSPTAVLNGVAVTNVTTSGADIYVTLGAGAFDGKIDYKINVLAIGLTL
jgi:hypothetical protein